jgi:hypothetical protein
VFLLSSVLRVFLIRTSNFVIAMVEWIRPHGPAPATVGGQASLRKAIVDI